MRLPQIAVVVCFICSTPDALSAQSMGATSRADVQIVASVAPRIQISEAGDPTLQAGQSQLCIRANAPMDSYSLISVDSSGAERPVTAVSSPSLCEATSGFYDAALGSASGPKSASALTMLLIAPE